jgi:7-carboxy-7-deazaguanine synthase
MTVDEVLKALGYLWNWQRYSTIVVMSGGEPLMQTIPLARLARKLQGSGCAVHIETAGTITPSAELDLYVDQYNVSPKLSNSGNPERKRNKPKVMTWFRNCDRAFFKFVVTELSDLDEVDSIVHNYCLPRFRVQVMPEGQTTEQNIKVAKEVAEEAIRRGYGVSFRTHVLLWGDERGH